MSVSLNPGTALGFNRPLTQHVRRSLAITNNNAQPVAFKVKTTAPKLYCVRPNSGRVEPGETVEVQVMLQAMKEEPALSAKCKDKFLIQSTAITPEKESMSLQDIWNDGSEEVHSQKLRVVYLPPEGQTVPEEEEGGHMSMLVPPSVMGDTRFLTMRRGMPEGNGHVEGREHSGEESFEGQHHEEEVHADASSTPPPDVARREELAPQEPAPQSEERGEGIGIVNVNILGTTPPSPPAPLAPISEPNAELVEKLHNAQAEIERLRNIISSMPEPSTAPTTTTTSPADLRRRRPYSDDTSSLDGQTDVGSYVEDALVQPDGVPLQVVILIALGVFVTTYLFF
ncbi:Uncharacterized protein C17C9.12 [Grifola frondosa]|uniref:Uncharacterized protein C17C9.12 n=1 Tax=Grifola frondosa TaxID=5627 RepID=A0A1C7M3A4_GRIFR|nr:Uncharacterized protein C17C9.12 [Grifola frondosa]